MDATTGAVLPPGHPVGVGLWCQDRLEERLGTVARAEARLERLKHDLISTVNHELRTPLANILGYCELLDERDDLDPSVRAMVEVIERNSNRLVDLISDLLLLADLDSGRGLSPWQRLDLAELVLEVADQVRDPAGAAGVQLRVGVDLPGPQVRGCRDQILRAVHHLATNAVKYAGSGSTAVIVVAADGDQAVVEVSDDGAGIDPSELPAMLERFARADRVRADQVQGAGIGLAVVNSVVTHHGGRFELDSVLGRGTTARFRLGTTTG